MKRARAIPDVAQPQDERGLRPATIWAFVVLVGVIFALSFGLNYGTSNQDVYLLGALRQVQPELLSNDWFATQTTDYHHFFTYLSGLMLRMDSSGWIFAVANVLMIIGVTAIIYLLARLMTAPREHVAVFTLVVAFSLATATLSAGDTYLTGIIFQPSTIGAAGFLLACYFFIKGSHALSGLALAVGGLFHANYLLLGFPTFLIAHLLLGGRGLVSRAIRQFTLPLAALIPFVPTLIASALSPDSAHAYLIYTTIRSPHHLVPSQHWRQFLPLTGWLLLFALSVPRRDLFSRRLSPATALVTSMSLLIILATLLTTVVFIPSVAQVFVWRLSPLLVVLVQIYIARALVRALDHEPYDGATQSGLQAVLLASIPVYLLSVYYVHLVPTPPVKLLLAVLGITLALAWAVRADDWRSPLRVFRLSIAVAMIVFLSVGAHGLMHVKERSTFLRPRVEAKETLYEWARTTDLDAVFLIPPQLRDFRFHSQRAIVVDWKAVPALPAEIEEWYTRITDLSGGDEPLSEGEAAQSYAGLQAEQLESLADRYSVSYVVLAANSTSDISRGWREVFRNTDYVVLQVAPG